MAMIEDLGVFFDTDDFATTATVAGGGSMPVIFDREYIDALGGSQGVGATRPVTLVRQSDVDTLGIGVDVEITIDDGASAFWGTTRFVVRELQPDGTGLVLLILEAS